MARLFTTGGEESDPLALWDVFDLIGVTGTYSAQILAHGKNDYIATEPRTGRGMYVLDYGQSLLKDFGSSTAHTEIFAGFAFYFTLNSTQEFFICYTDDPGVYTNRLALHLNADGSVAVARSGVDIATSVAAVCVANNWYYIEVWFKPLDAGGRAVVKVDGATVIDFTGDTTAEEAFVNAVRYGGIGNASNFAYFDDIVINDQSGSYNNTYPGMVRLLPIRPEDGGNYADWVRAGVDLGTDEAQARNGSFDFTMLQTTDADDKVTFTPELPDLPVGATIQNIVISARARVEAGAGVIAPMVRSNGTDDISADQTLISTWRYYQYAWPLNPDDSGAWAEADLATLEIGVSS